MHWAMLGNMVVVRATKASRRPHRVAPCRCITAPQRALSLVISHSTSTTVASHDRYPRCCERYHAHSRCCACQHRLRLFRFLLKYSRLFMYMPLSLTSVVSRCFACSWYKYLCHRLWGFHFYIYLLRTFLTMEIGRVQWSCYFRIEVR